MSLAFVVILLGSVLSGAVACFRFLPFVIAIITAIVGAPFMIWFAVLLYGLQRRAQPLRPFNASEHEQDAARLGGEGRHITTDDGRIVEYLVYGSKRPDAQVIVQMHS